MQKLDSCSRRSTAGSPKDLTRQTCKKPEPCSTNCPHSREREKSKKIACVYYLHPSPPPSRGREFNAQRVSAKGGKESNMTNGAPVTHMVRVLAIRLSSVLLCLMAATVPCQSATSTTYTEVF